MIGLLDTHQHLLQRDRLGYAWSDALPALAGQSFTVEAYAQLTAGKGIAQTIFMEADADDYRAEARYVAELVHAPENRLVGIIAGCRPEGPGAAFEAWLDECAALPVVGVRRILHEAPDPLSQTDSFRRNVGMLAQRGLVFDICARADQLGIAADLVRSCPDTSFVLDHCGVPDIASGEMEAWRQGIDRMAELPNVSCKISGVLAYCAEGAAHLDAIRPYVAHVIDSFTPDRLLWGSDWPVVNLRAALPDWIDMFRALIADLSPDEQRMICSGTAARVYGLLTR